MSKILPNFSKFLQLCKIGHMMLLVLFAGTYRVYPRHIIHSGRLLWDRGLENTYFTLLNEFHVKNITQFCEILTSMQNRSYTATDYLRGTGIADLKTRISLF